MENTRISALEQRVAELERRLNALTSKPAEQSKAGPGTLSPDESRKVGTIEHVIAHRTVHFHYAMNRTSTAPSVPILKTSLIPSIISELKANIDGSANAGKSLQDVNVYVEYNSARPGMLVKKTGLPYWASRKNIMVSLVPPKTEFGLNYESAGYEEGITLFMDGSLRRINTDDLSTKKSMGYLKMFILYP